MSDDDASRDWVSRRKTFEMMFPREDYDEHLFANSPKYAQAMEVYRQQRSTNETYKKLMEIHAGLLKAACARFEQDTLHRRIFNAEHDEPCCEASLLLCKETHEVYADVVKFFFDYFSDSSVKPYAATRKENHFLHLKLSYYS